MVSDDYERTPCCLSPQAVDEEGFSRGVESRSRLVENYESAPAEKSAGYGDALRLTLTETCPALAAGGVKALGREATKSAAAVWRAEYISASEASGFPISRLLRMVPLSRLLP